MKLKVIDAVRFQLPLFRLVTWADLDSQGTYREVVCELLPLCAMCYVLLDYPSPPLLLLLARIHIIWCPLCPTRLTTSPQSPSVFPRKKGRTKLLRTWDIQNILLAGKPCTKWLPAPPLWSLNWKVLMADGLHHDGKVPNEVFINSLKAPVDLSRPKGSPNRR